MPHPGETLGISIVAAQQALQQALASVNGPSIDPSMNLTWTGQQTFSNAGTANETLIALRNPVSAADLKNVLIRTGNAGQFQVWSATDAAPLVAVTNLIGSTRVGAAWATLTFGNNTDNPTYSFIGTSTPRHGGSQLIQTTAALTNNAAAAVATLTNSPTVGNPTKWIPINDNGTIRNIPAW